MLNLSLIEELSRRLKIAPLNIIREHLEMETLYSLSRSALSEHILFYGGTALRLAYQSFRYSEDLDFLFIHKTPSLKKGLEQIMQQVTFENPGTTLEDVFEKRWTLFGLLHIRHELLKHPIRMKIEIHKKVNGIDNENVLLTSPVSTRQVILKVATPQAILALKAKTLESRKQPRDWFDYWYLCQRLRFIPQTTLQLPFPKRLFKNELQRWLPRDQWKAIDLAGGFYG
ncbi:MAG: nucleotidyl transferase AbiEii/AbiGii toxin family protein [Deltaproteobacteria bacterium]|nr:nucleotidyl transferase AbiEii/AbiGii toxin family protein [Deltaproteobacteria bacterium]